MVLYTLPRHFEDDVHFPKVVYGIFQTQCFWCPPPDDCQPPVSLEGSHFQWLASGIIFLGTPTDNWTDKDFFSVEGGGHSLEKEDLYFQQILLDSYVPSFTFYLILLFSVLLTILPIIWRHLVVTKGNLTNSVFTIPGQFPSILYTCHSSNNLETSYPGLPLNQRLHFPESVDAKLVLLFQSAGLLLQPSGLSVSRCFL